MIPFSQGPGILEKGLFLAYSRAPCLEPGICLGETHYFFIYSHTAAVLIAILAQHVDFFFFVPTNYLTPAGCPTIQCSSGTISLALVSRPTT